MWDRLNVEQLGVSAIIVVILIYQNWELRKDVREEREYSRKLNRIYQESGMKLLDTLKNLEQAFILLRDSLK
jgi:hypothetical protein